MRRVALALLAALLFLGLDWRADPVAVAQYEAIEFRFEDFFNAHRRREVTRYFEAAALLNRFSQTHGGYLVVPLATGFLYRNRTTERFWGPEHRELTRVVVRDGLLVDADGNPLDTSLARVRKVDDNGQTIEVRTGRAMFVMDWEGNFFSFPLEIRDVIHHSSLLAGRPVAAAGEWIVSRGRLRRISNGSGHYLPARFFLMQAVRRLRELGVRSQTPGDLVVEFLYDEWVATPNRAVELRDAHVPESAYAAYETPWTADQLQRLSTQMARAMYADAEKTLRDPESSYEVLEDALSIVENLYPRLGENPRDLLLEVETTSQFQHIRQRAAAIHLPGLCERLLRNLGRFARSFR